MVKGKPTKPTKRKPTRKAPPKKRAPTKSKTPKATTSVTKPEKDVAVNDETKYDQLSARQKRLVANIYRLWLRRHTIEQIVEMLEEKDGTSISYITVRRYLKVIRDHTRSRYERQSLDDILDEEAERFNEIIATLWNDHAQASPGSPARVGAMNAIIGAETRIAEMQGLAVNRLKVDADVNGRVTGFLDLDVGEETLEQLDGIIEKLIAAGQARPSDAAA